MENIRPQLKGYADTAVASSRCVGHIYAPLHGLKVVSSYYQLILMWF